MKKTGIYLVFFINLILAGCSYDFPEEAKLQEEDFGEINPRQTLVIGDGFLGGFMDGALYNDGQKNSVGLLLNNQLNLIDSIPFNQADINSEHGFNIYASNTNAIYGRWFYQFANQTDEQPQLSLKPGEEITPFNSDKNLLNDLTVPQLSVRDLGNANFNENPFQSRVYSENASNLIEQIKEKSPSLVFLWIGMNDFLQYATKGATLPNEFTSTELFRTNFQNLIHTITSNSDAQIIVGDLISIKDLPYFYHRPYNSIFLEGSDLNAAFSRYSAYNKAVAEHNRSASSEEQRPFIVFLDNGSNLAPQSIVVIDNTLSDANYSDGSPLEKYRQVTKNEFVFYLLTDEKINEGFGSVIPMEEDSYLSEENIDLIENRTDVFNTIIYETINEYSEKTTLIPFHDEIHKIAETGKKDAWGEPLNNEIIYFDGLPVEGTIDINGIFSLDGLHFNQRGNAYLSNLIILQMNKELNSNIPTININTFVGNTFSD